jgi:hypothetical protein
MACLAIEGNEKIEGYIRNIFKNSNVTIRFEESKTNQVEKV